MTNPTLQQPWKQPTPDWGLAPEGRSQQPLPETVAVEDVLRFQQAMHAPDHASQNSLPSGPFALFGAPANPVQQSAPVASESLSCLMQSMVQQLMVTDGSQSFRRVRIELADDVMPGVVLTMGEEEGAVVAELTCRLDEAYWRLSQPAQSLASQLAVTLGRDTVWRVLPDPAAHLSFTETIEARGQPTDTRNNGT
jgi:hypothetical protein